MTRRKRIKHSSTLYLTASEIHFNFVRSNYILIWRDITDKRRKSRASDVLFMFLRSVKHLKKHMKAKAIVLKIIKARKRGLKIEFLLYWVGRHERYQKTVYRYAIRTWVKAMLQLKKGEFFFFFIIIIIFVIFFLMRSFLLMHTHGWHRIIH